MELTIRIPDHTAAIFDYLQKGLFISQTVQMKTYAIYMIL